MVGCHLVKAVIPGREGVKGLAPEGETTEFARENRAKLMQLAIHLGFSHCKSTVYSFARPSNLLIDAGDGRQSFSRGRSESA